MKINLIGLFLFVLFLNNQIYSDEKLLKKNDIVDFFNGNYTVLNETINVDENCVLNICVHYINQQLGVYDKAIFYEENDNDIIVYLMIDKFIFLNSSGSIIENFSLVKNIRGFSSSKHTSPISKLDLGIYFTGHFGDELYASDPFYIDWDNSEKDFFRYVRNYDDL